MLFIDINITGLDYFVFNVKHNNITLYIEPRIFRSREYYKKLGSYKNILFKLACE